MNLFKRFSLLMAHLLFWKNTRLDTAHRQVPLGVQGLVTPACEADRVSVLLIRDAELGRRCALGAAHDFQQSGPLAILAAGAVGQQFMDSCLDSCQQVTHGKPLFLSMTDHCAVAMEQYGVSRLFDELDVCAVTAQHAVLLQGGETIFDWLNPTRLVTQWQAWNNWAANRHAPVLLIIEDINGNHGLLSLLRSLPGLVSNLAVLDADSGGGLLTIERWTGQEKQDVRQFGLKLSEQDQFLHLDGVEIDASGKQILDAPDQERVIATAATVAGVKGVPVLWTVVPDLSSVEAACQDAVAATVLLHADDSSEFGILSQLVHRLRLSHPRALKIIVWEVGNKLRYNNELVLMRLGANTVVYKEIAFSRLLTIINDLAAQVYTRPIEHEYLLALQAAEPNPIVGYLAPPVFCREVTNMLKRTERISLGHTLVRLPLLSRVAHLDALLACRARRFGDIFTADQHQVYLFLFACRESDVDSTLDQIFSVPVAELFSSVIIESQELILETVGKLERDHELSPTPDFSAMLPANLSDRDDEVDRSIALHKTVQLAAPSLSIKEVSQPVIKCRIVHPSPLRVVTDIFPSKIEQAH